MPVTVTVDSTTLLTPDRSVRGTIQFDSSYLTGGEPVTPANFGLTYLTDLQVEPAAGYTFTWNRSTTNPTVLAFRVGSALSTPQAEVPNGVDLSTVIARYTAFGR